MQTFSCTVPASKQLLLWLSTNLNVGFYPVYYVASLCAWRTRAASRSYSGDQTLLVGRSTESALADVSRVSWGQLRCFTRSQVSTTLCQVALPWHGDVQCWEQKPCSHCRKGKESQWKDSFMKSQKWSQLVREQIPFLFGAFLKMIKQDCTPRLLGFSFGKEFKDGVSKYVLLSMREISKMHVPTGWVTKTTLSLETVQVPVIYVQPARNYSGTCSSCSNRSTHAVVNSVIFIYFVATLYNVKYWGLSLLTFLVRLLQFHVKALLKSMWRNSIPQSCKLLL